MLQTPLFLALILAATGGAGAASSIVVESESPLSVVGASTLTFRGADGLTAAGRATENVQMHVLQGDVTLWVWQESVTEAPVLGSVRQSTAAPTTTTWRLAPGAFELAVEDEGFMFALAAAEDGVVSISDQADASGVPTVLSTDVARYPARRDPVPTAPEAVPGPYAVAWEWPAGSVFAGDFMIAHEGGGTDLVRGFPRPVSPTVALRGTWTVEVVGGIARFEDDAGESHEVALRPSPTATPSVREVRKIVVNATLAPSTLPTGESWGFASASATLDVDGVVAWTRAQIRGEHEGRRVDTPDADVRLEGTPVLVFAADAATDAAPEYPVSGEFTLILDGRPVVSPANPVAAVEVASWTAVLLGIATLGLRFLPAMYTRIAPDRLLDNANRRAIYDRVLAQPGIHQRELHRTSGGAWGPFTFHVRLLREAGYLRVEDQGRYKLVFPAGSSASATGAVAAIPHPVTRAVYEAVPPAGAVIAFPELREKVGLSRQLLSYHLRALETRGLVAAVPLPERQRGVRRLEGAHATPPRPS